MTILIFERREKIYQLLNSYLNRDKMIYAFEIVILTIKIIKLVIKKKMKMNDWNALDVERREFGN